MSPRLRKPNPPETVSNFNQSSTAALEPLEPPEIDSAVQQNQNPFGYPDTKKNSIWDYMRKLTPEQWDNHTWYLYRTDPVGEFQKGQSRFREKGSVAIDEGYVSQKYGGYRWMLMLNRYDQKGNATEIYKARFSIEAAPKVQPGERLLEPDTPAAAAAPSTAVVTQETQGLYRLVERMMDRMDKMSDVRNRPSEEQSTAQKAMANAIDIQAAGMRSAVEMVKAAVVVPAQPATDPITQIRAVSSILKDLRPENPPGGNSIEQVNAIFDLVEKIQAKVTPEGGAAAGGGKWGWVDVLTGAVGKLAGELLTSPGGQALASMLLAKLVMPNPAQHPGQTIVQQPATLAAAANPSPAPAAAESTVTVTGDQYKASVRHLGKEVLVRMFMAEESGAAFAEWMMDTDIDEAEQLFRMLKMAALNPAILDPWKQDELLRKLFDPTISTVRLIKFATEFIAYMEEEEGAGEEKTAGLDAIAKVVLAYRPKEKTKPK